MLCVCRVRACVRVRVRVNSWPWVIQPLPANTVQRMRVHGRYGDTANNPPQLQTINHLFQYIAQLGIYDSHVVKSSVTAFYK